MGRPFNDTRAPQPEGAEVAEWLLTRGGYGTEAAAYALAHERRLVNDLLAALKETTAALIDAERELDEFHGLGVDAGSGSSETVCNAQAAIRKAQTLPESQ